MSINADRTIDHRTVPVPGPQPGFLMVISTLSLTLSSLSRECMIPQDNYISSQTSDLPRSGSRLRITAI